MWQLNRSRLSMVLMVMTLAPAALQAATTAAHGAGTTAEPGATVGPRCPSTGPTCHEVYDCSWLPAGDYQWCGSCGYALRCQGSGNGQVHMTGDFNEPFWDDNIKAFANESTTCSECYVRCPPWATVPPEHGSGRCSKTGPTCVPDVNFCSNVAGSKKFQHCDHCNTYVYCTGSVDSSFIAYCYDGTYFDDNIKDCTSFSHTCVECYQPCNGNETLPEPTAGTLPPQWVTTQQDLTTGTTSRLLTTLMPTTEGPPSGGPEGGEGPGGCGSGSLVVNLEGKDVKFELDLRLNNPPKEKTDEGRPSSELIRKTFLGSSFKKMEQKTSASGKR